MLIVLLFVTFRLFGYSSSTVTFDEDLDDVGLLKCNWAQAYLDDEEIVDDAEIQHEIMLLASHWEGKFGRHGIGIDQDQGLLSGGVMEPDNYGCVADYDSGLIHEFVEISEDAMYTALLALALNGSPYASQFFRSSMQTQWNGTLETFLVKQLENKIDSYEYAARYRGFSGLFKALGAALAPNEEFIYFNTVGYLVWPMLAIAHQLGKHANTSSIGERYQNYVDIIADNLLMIFYYGNGRFAERARVLEQFSQPAPSSYQKDESTNCTLAPFDDELTLYFAYFFANWTSYGGDEERQKMWQPLRDNIKKASYKLDDDTVIDVEASTLYASAERFKYLVLPYLDVKEQEQLHYAGELVRTHHSAANHIPGLFTYGWKFVDHDYKEKRLDCGIAKLGQLSCPNNDHVCSSAAFSMILNPKLRGIGLVWYLTMLRSPKMQGPFGISACVKIPSVSVSFSLKWNSKLPQLLAFNGGLSTIIRDILNKTGHLQDFYDVVRENIAVFRNSNQLFPPYLFRPSARLNEQLKRFSACSAGDYTRTKPTVLPLITEKSASSVLIYLGIASIFLVSISLIGVLGIVLRRQIKRNRNVALLINHSYRERYDPDWEVHNDALLIEKEPIGAGAFAVVFKGVLTELPQIYRNGSRSLNALNWMRAKEITVAVKCPASDTERCDFAREIEFMKTVGYHSRLVNMLASISVTEGLKLVIEYCANGDLLQYLRKTHEQLKTTTTNVPDLMSFAWQINEGMIYLSLKNCVHRDLSARNILLTDRYSAKISDFGLARTLIDSEYKSTGGMLPFRILSPEAISRMVYSIKSDVWAYGILLYEIFSLGNTPYSNMSEASILQFLIAGNRLEQPNYASDVIYRLANLCWQFEACDRPSFSAIGAILRAEMEGNDASSGYVPIDSALEKF